jgi:hypothetical protein
MTLPGCTILLLPFMELEQSVVVVVVRNINNRMR